MSKVWRYGDHIDTDVIIPARYLNIADFKELAEHAMEDAKENLEINFAANVQPGDYIVAGKNFGCGSSREQAPEVIKALGIPCIIAKSFARIFYRNALNNGLLLLEQPELHDVVKEGDTITVTVNEDVEYNGKKYPIASLPENLMEIIEAGGLVKAMRKRNGLD